MAFEKVATVESLWSGEKMSAVVGGKKVLLIHIDDRVYAYADRCCHKGVALSEGRLEGTVLTCRAHEWQYDVRTGRGVNPANVRLESYAVKIAGGEILVDVEEQPRADEPAGVP
jgi:toluene monooxygenase system ferredoxin subunit